MINHATAPTYRNLFKELYKVNLLTFERKESLLMKADEAWVLWVEEA